jgi:hypothetical protein
MTTHSRRFNADARRLRRRIERRDERLLSSGAKSHIDDGAALVAPDGRHRHDGLDEAPFEARVSREDDEKSEVDVGGLAGMVKGFFSRRKARVKPEERGDPAPSDDPVRQVLAVPRGAARLDAFEHTLSGLTAKTHGHKSVALAFHRELTSMSSEAGLDLSLLGNRVDACANGLVDAGELERAGEILMAAGKKERAAALFSEAGAVDKLDEASFAMALESGTGTLDARLAVDRVQNLMQVGRRSDALSLLGEAQKRFPRAHEVATVARTWLARLPAKGRVLLASDRASVVVDTRWPIVLGRSEDTALPLPSPLLSREHAEIRRDGDALVLVPRTPRARLFVDDRPASEQALRHEGTLSLDGVLFTYRVGADALLLALKDAPSSRHLAVPFSSTVMLDEPCAMTIRFDKAGRATVDAVGGLRVNGEIIHAPLVLFVDDELVHNGQTVRVVRG